VAARQRRAYRHHGARVAIPIINSPKDERDALKENLSEIEMSPIHTSRAPKHCGSVGKWPAQKSTSETS
jgi:hypothetical protein